MRKMRKSDDVFEAIAEGVDRAISRMICGTTDMPCADFWTTLEESIKKAFEKVAMDAIENRQADDE